jgi:hypothetical protein
MLHRCSKEGVRRLASPHRKDHQALNSAFLLVASVALPFRHHCFGLASPVSAQRFSDAYLVGRELSVLVAPRVSFIFLMGLS